MRGMRKNEHIHSIGMYRIPERWLSLTRGIPDLAHSYVSSRARPLLRVAQHYHSTYMVAYRCEYQSQACVMFLCVWEGRTSDFEGSFFGTNQSFQIQQYFSNMLSASQWLEEGLREKLQKRKENIAKFKRMLQDAKREQKSALALSRKYSYKATKAMIDYTSCPTK